MSTVLSDPPNAPTPRGDWEVTWLGRDSWRICDRARRQGDADCLIAYVERNSTGSLDVLWLRRPCPRRTRFRDFAQLLGDLDAAVSAASDRSRAPSPIPHLPPR
ncbi:hypothetical protein ACTJJ4_08980 [Microbacterium sp. 22195]|jgi:hypothetical protein|uniref:hypothetical protein n=1 Tax=Microbacterium sp. 22195 TaxID=3453891 RepID=UPI003F84C864